MPKRLLFVDDDAMVLDGLRRSLHNMRHDWEMHFVDSAAAALAILGNQPFDAVVSDMRMPVKDGAQLLEEVKELYPDVVRMILSGQSSREAVYRSIAPAHQFLSKPCDPQELAARLTQAFLMRDLLSNQAIKTVISNLRSIPSLPALYDELTDALHSETPSLSQIAKIISKDVGMAAKILQLANSAFVGTSGRVSSLAQALSLIGTETVRTLALSIHVFSQFEGNAQIKLSLPALWEHSMAVSGLAQRIAGAERRTRALIEESFAAGLLHDVGKVVLLAELPRQYQQVFEGDPACGSEREREQLGCTHSEIGGYLMSIWGIPMPLVRAVAFHHHPSEAGESAFSALTAVHAADAIASATDAHAVNRDIALDLNYLDQLGLRNRESVWRDLHAESAPAVPGQAQSAQV